MSRVEQVAKNALICFRTNEELRLALEGMARSERRGLSSTIEKVLYEYVRQREPEMLNADRRRYPRLKTLLPALVGTTGGRCAGAVVDVSLGGLRVSVPHDFDNPGEASRIRVVLPLAEGGNAVAMDCSPRHFIQTESGIYVGAMIVDTDFAGYRHFQDHLLRRAGMEPLMTDPAAGRAAEDERLDPVPSSMVEKIR